MMLKGTAHNNLQFVHHTEVEESPKSGKCPLLSQSLSQQLALKIFQTIDQILSSQLPAIVGKTHLRYFI